MVQEYRSKWQVRGPAPSLLMNHTDDPTGQFIFTSRNMRTSRDQGSVVSGWWTQGNCSFMLYTGLYKDGFAWIHTASAFASIHKLLR